MSSNTNRLLDYTCLNYFLKKDSRGIVILANYVVENYESWHDDNRNSIVCFVRHPIVDLNLLALSHGA